MLSLRVFVCAMLIVASGASFPASMMGFQLDMKLLDLELLKKDPLMQAILDGSAEEVRAAIRNGSNVNQIVDGLTPLLFAISREHFEIAKLLINEGADAAAVSRSVRPINTLVSVLTISGDSENFRELFDWLEQRGGATPGIINDKDALTGQTLLHSLAMTKPPQLIGVELVIQCRCGCECVGPSWMDALAVCFSGRSCRRG